MAVTLAPAEGATTSRLVLVSGASSGIGAAVCRRLATDGAHVVGLDLQPPLTTDRGPGNSIIDHRTVDVTDGAAVELAVSELEASHGSIRQLVCAAGVLVAGKLLELPGRELERALAVNCLGVFHLLQAVGRRMAARRDGAIVTVTSNAASTPRDGLGAYAASKAAARMLTHCMALELAKCGVRCNTVAPGSTNTPMLTALLGGDAAVQAIQGDPQRYRLGIPLGRVAEPDDVAAAVAFLLSNAARHITLQELKVDGGATL